MVALQPDNMPFPVPVVIDNVMGFLSEVTGLPAASSIAMTGWAAQAVAAVPPPGWVLNTSWSVELAMSVSEYDHVPTSPSASESVPETG